MIAVLFSAQRQVNKLTYEYWKRLAGIMHQLQTYRWILLAARTADWNVNAFGFFWFECLLWADFLSFFAALRPLIGPRWALCGWISSINSNLSALFHKSLNKKQHNLPTINKEKTVQNKISKSGVKICAFSTIQQKLLGYGKVVTTTSLLEKKGCNSLFYILNFSFL